MASASSTSSLPRLHVIVDSLALAEAALEGGTPEIAIQVRSKAGSDAERYSLVDAIARCCRAAGALCIVNDRLDLALAVGAGGVHLGATDLPIAAARRIAPESFLIGGTARDAERGQLLVDEGADYLGVGPAYTTRSKSGLPDPVGPEGVGAVANAVAVPVIAIGGITAATVPALREAGAHGVAVIAAVSEASDPRAATAALVQALADDGVPTGSERP